MFSNSVDRLPCKPCKAVVLNMAPLRKPNDFAARIERSTKPKVEKLQRAINFIDRSLTGSRSLVRSFVRRPSQTSWAVGSGGAEKQVSMVNSPSPHRPSACSLPNLTEARFLFRGMSLRAALMMVVFCRFQSLLLHNTVTSRAAVETVVAVEFGQKSRSTTCLKIEI